MDGEDSKEDDEEEDIGVMLVKLGGCSVEGLRWNVVRSEFWQPVNSWRFKQQPDVNICGGNLLWYS